MDLPLLRNMYSVLFAKYESELLTPGANKRQGLLGREPQAPVLLQHFQKIHLARVFGLKP